jgi:2-methylisocitrate lyase-like PEP mutase family enzyme
MHPTAARFHALNAGKPMLLLPNAWDAGSARILEHAGAQAIATSSAAVSWAQGFADGGHLPPARLLDVVSGICRVCSVPVSVDIEDGLFAANEEMADFVEKLGAAGAVGINIEDGHSAPGVLASRIRTLRSRPALAGLFINARTDVVLRSLVSTSEIGAEVTERARRYKEAGANSVFVPGLTDETTIADLVAKAPAPINLMVCQGLPSLNTLANLGVHRVSTGPAPFLSAFAGLAAEVRSFLSAETVESRATGLSCAEMDALFPTAKHK